MSKRIAATSVAALAAMSVLAACTSSPVTPAAGTGAIAGEVTMLTPLFASDADKAAFKASLAKFNQKYPDVTVKVDFTDYGKLNEKVTTGLASGLLPDILQLGVGWVAPLASKGVIVPLDDQGVTPAQLADQFPAAAAGAAQYNGHAYAMPFITGGLQGVYRKDYFKEAGLDPEKAPTTWAELRKAAIATTVRGADGTLERAGFNVFADNLRQNFVTLVGSDGGHLFSADGTKATLNSTEGVDALTFISDLVNKDKVVDVGFGSGAPMNPILSGKAAIGFYGISIPCDKPDIVSAEVCNNLGYFAIPGNTAGKGAVFLGGTMSALTAGSKNPQAAAALIKFMSSEPDVAFSTTTSQYSIPAAVASWKDARVTGTPSSVHYISVIDSAVVEGGPVTWLDTRNDFGPALESVIVGGADPKTALDGLAKQADAAIAAAQ